MAMRRRSLADRLVARAMALAIDPAGASTQSAAALRRLAGANHDALHRALRRIEARHPDRPSKIAQRAACTLRLAIAAPTGALTLAPTPEVDVP